jgi:hypothetical protein
MMQIALCCVAVAVAILLMLALSNYLDSVEKRGR